uniref:zinc finger BED domain-containing protein RICESLEEPER 3-like n=1 Tax=Fragaria vesca subsp. vesca TaxID=101020 RepID=UPI0005CB695D|nr:PREDICTED: zinc finger BED domain-containing protein RICESLEEPER 3-like [Fragaria vesca subsp. vesca]
MDDDDISISLEPEEPAVVERGTTEVSAHKRKKTSRCWLSFKQLPVSDDQIERAKCTKCGAVYKCDKATGTGSLIRHHDLCYNKDIVVSPHSSTRSSKFSHEKFRELIVEAIIRHDLPFRFVEYEGIRAVFHYISPILKLPCRNTVKSHITKLFDSEKLKLRSILSCVQGRICLTSDLWSSQTTDGYLTLTARWIDLEWKLHKKIISFCRFPPPHNGIALAEKINSLICEWEIEKKLFSITLDNASANDSFVEKLRTQLNFRGLLLLNGKFFHVRCCAHILNLIVQDGLKSIDQSVIKIIECLKYIKGSMARKERFLGCIDQVGMGDFKCCPSFDEWIKVEQTSRFLGYFYDVTCLFSGTKYPTSNLFFPKVFMIQHNIQQAMKDKDAFMRQMANDMNLKFEKYWSDYSLKAFKDTLSSLFNVYVDKWSPDNASGFMGESCSQTEGEDAFFQDFDATYTSGSSLSVKSELQKYLDEERLDRKKKEFDILSWWKMEQLRYPVLGHLARDVLTIPISTVASESAFSIAGRVLDQNRSSLLPETVQALLCCRDWLFGKKDQDHTDWEQLSENVLDLTLDR